MKEYFSIDDLATMTMLTTRTIRNYITQGFLTGEKIDGTWRFTVEDMETFFKHDFVKQSLECKKNTIVYDFMSNDVKKESSVCSIYDYADVGKEEADQICKEMLDLVNSNRFGQFRFSYTYNHKKKLVRIIITGSIMGIHALMTQYLNNKKSR